jgi:hypothetical protein
VSVGDRSVSRRQSAIRRAFRHMEFLVGASMRPNLSMGRVFFIRPLSHWAIHRRGSNAIYSVRIGESSRRTLVSSMDVKCRPASRRFGAEASNRRFEQGGNDRHRPAPYRVPPRGRGSGTGLRLPWQRGVPLWNSGRWATPEEQRSSGCKRCRRKSIVALICGPGECQEAKRVHILYS